MGRVKKIKGSTLVETLVAIVIITMTISMGFAIYFNVLSSGTTDVQLSAQIECLTWLEESIGTNDYESDTKYLSHFQLVKTVEKENNLYLVKIEAINKEQKNIASVTRYVYAYDQKE